MVKKQKVFSNDYYNEIADISKIVDSFGGKITLTTTPGIINNDSYWYKIEEEDDYRDINKPFTQKDPKRFHFGCMDFSTKEPTEQEIQEALAAKKEKEKQDLEKCKRLGVKLPKTENKEEEKKDMEEC